jgi:hypothetical protein
MKYEGGMMEDVGVTAEQARAKAERMRTSYGRSIMLKEAAAMRGKDISAAEVGSNRSLRAHLASSRVALV